MTPSPAAQNPALDPDALLAGPRGRRLCLEIASIAALAASGDPDQSDFGLARFYASYSLDPGRGRSVVMYGSGADAELPQPSPRAVAALLDAVPLPELGERDLLQALGAAVDFARYWQSPDGDDVLAATPEMRRALLRFAQLLAESSLTRGWTAPMDPRAQWAVAFTTDPPRPPAEPKMAAQALADWHADTIAEEQQAMAERPADPEANYGGTWWSRPPWELPTSTRTLTGEGPLGLHLVEDDFGPEEAVVEQLLVPAGLRILEINSPDDWAQLCREHPLGVTASKRHDWYRTTGRSGAWVMPDWTAVKEKYDGVHLTVGGYLATAGLEIPVDGDRSSVLAGWNPDATYWFRDLAAEPDSHQKWARVHDHPAWSLQGSGPRSLTAPARSSWTWNHGEYQGWSGMTRLGAGEELWQRVRHDVLSWKAKTRSGFTVDSPLPVAEGQRLKVTAHFLGAKVVEPVEVLAVVDEPDRAGFSYRTLPGHPVSGEEAFIVDRFGDEVHLTIRSLTKAAPQQPWRALFPLLLVAQKAVRKRYMRALR